MFSISLPITIIICLFITGFIVAWISVGQMGYEGDPPKGAGFPLNDGLDDNCC